MTKSNNVERFPSVSKFKSFLSGITPARMAFMGISLEAVAINPVVVGIKEEEKNMGFSFEPTEFAYASLQRPGKLNGEKVLLMPLGGSKFRAIIQKAQAAVAIKKSNVASSEQKTWAEKTFGLINTVTERVLDCNVAISEWLVRGGYARNIVLRPLTETCVIPTATEDGTSLIHQDRRPTRYPMTAVIFVGRKPYVLADIPATTIAWNGEEIAPEFQLVLDGNGNIQSLFFSEGNLLYKVTAEDLATCLKNAQNIGGLYFTSVKELATVSYSTDETIKSLGDVFTDEAGEKMLEVSTTSHHLLLPVSYLLGNAPTTTIRTVKAAEKGEVRVVSTTEGNGENRIARHLELVPTGPNAIEVRTTDSGLFGKKAGN